MNEVIPLNAPSQPEVPLAPIPEDILQQKEKIVPTTTDAPKKKIHVSLDIPDASVDSEDDDEDDENPPRKQNKSPKGPQSPTYTYFPISFGRTTGGTIAIASAYSTGKGKCKYVFSYHSVERFFQTKSKITL